VAVREPTSKNERRSHDQTRSAVVATSPT